MKLFVEKPIQLLVRGLNQKNSFNLTSKGRGVGVWLSLIQEGEPLLQNTHCPTTDRPLFPISLPENKLLFSGRHPENKLLFSGRLPENKLLFPGRLPENKLLFLPCYSNLNELPANFDMFCYFSCCLVFLMEEVIFRKTSGKYELIFRKSSGK